MSRVTAATLALLLLAGSVGHATCQGWESSREAREDCCRRAHRAHCVQPGAADACCAGHQDSRQRVGPTFSPSVVPVPAAAVLFHTRAVEPSTTPAVVVERAQRLLHSLSPPPKPLRI
jgi:hypothetical protein